jgi:hypothetical protein
MQGMQPYQAASSNTQPLGADQSLARKQVESAMQQIRSANQLLDGLAAQFPAVAKEVKAAKDSLIKITTGIVGSQGQSESQPPTGVMG